MASMSQNASLLAKIEGGDHKALEAKYHLSCLATLRNRQRSHIWEIHSASEESLENKQKTEARAFVELVLAIHV